MTLQGAVGSDSGATVVSSRATLLLLLPELLLKLRG